MNSVNKQRCVGGLLIILCIILCAQAQLQAKSISASTNLLLYQYMAGQELTLYHRQQMEEEQGDYALANQETGVEAKAALTNRNINVTTLTIYGNTELFLADIQLITGAYPLSYTNQCIISSACAEYLWGSAEAIGLELEINERPYVVAGVVESRQPMVITTWNNQQDDYIFTYGAYMAPLGTFFIQQEFQQFLSRCGLSMPERTIAPAKTHIVLQFLSQLPFWVLMIGALEYCMNKTIPEGKPAYKYGKWIIRFSVIATLCFISKTPFFISAENMPTRWSDFSFWTGKIQQHTREVMLRWTSEGLLTEYLSWRTYQLPVILYSLISLILSLVVSLMVLSKKEKSL